MCFLNALIKIELKTSFKVTFFFNYYWRKSSNTFIGDTFIISKRSEIVWQIQIILVKFCIALNISGCPSVVNTLPLAKLQVSPLNLEKNIWSLCTKVGIKRGPNHSYNTAQVQHKLIIPSLSEFVACYLVMKIPTNMYSTKVEKIIHASPIL